MLRQPVASHGVRRETAEPASHADMLRHWRWRDAANVFLGLWLASTPLALDYREPMLRWNDVICGSLIASLALLTLSPRFDLARWGLCAAGLWLLFAPLVFWTTDAALYLNDTLVGALVIAFSVLIPMMPGRAHHEVMALPGPDTPPGWSYNPSDWIQRGPIVAMAFAGFFLSRHLASYQLGHIADPWDPFFGEGTRRVLESEVSRAWPVSDAGLGAVSYLIEGLSGVMGGRNRWRTMPWMVVMFGVLVVPLGIASIVLIMLQPVAVGAWCTLCLITAAAMLVMISPAVDEVVAMCQFLQHTRREGRPFWRTFWIGGTLSVVGTGDAAPAPASAYRSTAGRVLSAMDLLNVPWNLVVSAALGVWIMAAPAVLGIGGSAANSNYIAGALVITWAVIAFAQIARPARLLNVPIGLWLIAGPWLLAGEPGHATAMNMLAGALLVGLSIRRGRIDERFGNWNRCLI